MRKEIALTNIRKAHAYANKLVADIPAEKWFEIPGGNFSNIAWQYAHIAVSDYRLCLLRVRGEMPGDKDVIPPDFVELFAKGSTPGNDKYAPAELKEVMKKVTKEIEAEAALWSDELLEQPSKGATHPMFHSCIEALEYSAMHDFLHCGQLGVLRRQLGFSSLG